MKSLGKRWVTRGNNDREKVRIELVAWFIGAPDRRLQNR